MDRIEYGRCADPGHWLKQIRRCRWRSGKYLYELLSTDRLEERAGPAPKVLLLTKGRRLLSFGVLMEQKYDVASRLSPWLGFLYTFPCFRRKRLAGELIRWACELTRQSGRDHLYLSTKHRGLYERYGFSPIGTVTDWRGEEQLLYSRQV